MAVLMHKLKGKGLYIFDEPEAVLEEGSWLSVGVNRPWIIADGEHTCALRDDRSVWCWGSNGQGELGTGADYWLEPTAVAD